MIYIGTSAAQANPLTTLSNFIVQIVYISIIVSRALSYRKIINCCFLSPNFDLKLYFCIRGK